MKKLNLTSYGLTLALILCGCNWVYAGEGGPKPNGPHVESQIRDYFRFPAFVQPIPVSHEEKVEVLFSVDTTGAVNFVMAKTGNEEMKKLVEKRMQKMKLAKLNPDVIHSVMLRFKKRY